MAKRISEECLQAIEDAAGQRPEGMTTPQIEEALDTKLPRRTLQYRLQSLVDQKRLIREGSSRSTRYRLPITETLSSTTTGVKDFEKTAHSMGLPPISIAGNEILDVHSAAQRTAGTRRL